MATKISMKEAEDLLNFTIDNNRQLQDSGQTPLAISFTGDHGIGKTSLVEQVARKRGMTITKLSLHELEEVGDLIGYPVKEYKVVEKKSGKSGWVAADVLSRVDREKFNVTNESRMGYAKPAWVPQYNENGCILLLDDYARSSQMMIQATMELINTGRYVSWSLPKYTTLVLTQNPDNGEFNINSLDPAQRTRFMNYELEFNIDDWAKWAEGVELDSRAINFALQFSNELFKPQNNVTIACPRSYVTFCKAISGIKDWKSDLKRILLVSKGCFDDQDNAVGRIFSVFINNELDKLISPKDIFEKSWDYAGRKITEAINKDGNYRASVASMMATRIVNYIDAYFDKPGYVSAPVMERLEEMFEHKSFPEDLLFFIVKSVVSRHKKQAIRLLQNPEISNRLNIQ